MKREIFETGCQKWAEEMAQDNDEKLKATFSRQNWILYLWLSFFALIGVLLIVGAVTWKYASRDSGEKQLILQIGQRMAAAGAQPTDGSVAQPTKSLEDLVNKLVTESSQQDGLGPDLLRDLGIALLIAVFVTVVIELYASRRLREHIAHDVLSAAYAKVVPEKIYTQIRDNVFRSNVYRRNWEVHIKAIERQVDTGTGTAIIDVYYSYDLENLNEHRIQYPIYGFIDLDVPLPDQDIPKFKSIKIYDEHNQALVLEKHINALLEKQKETTIREGNLTFSRNTQEMRFTALVPIPPRRSVKVTYEVKRAIRIPGDYVLIAPVPADGIKIILTVAGFKLGVLALHPDRDALHQTQPDTWKFDAGILPWQGFRFTTEVSNTLEIV